MAGSTPNLRQKTRYGLTQEEFASLTKQLIERFDTFIQRARHTEQTSLCVALDGADPLADICRHIEWRGFARLADNLPTETMQAEYGPYDDDSLFLLGIDLRHLQPVATLRIIVGISGVGPPTKSLRDAVLHSDYKHLSTNVDLTNPTDQMSELPLQTVGAIASGNLPSVAHDRRSLEIAHGMEPGELILDIGTLARLSEVPTKEAGMIWTPLLVAGCLRIAELLGAKHAVTFVTSDLLRLFKRLCGATWRDLGSFGEVVYVPGDDFMSQPSYMAVHEFRDNLRSRRVAGVARPIPERNLDAYAHESEADSAFTF